MSQGLYFLPNCSFFLLLEKSRSFQIDGLNNSTHVLIVFTPESDNCLTEDETKQNISHFQDFVPINKAVNSFIESITMYIQGTLSIILNK